MNIIFLFFLYRLWFYKVDTSIVNLYKNTIKKLDRSLISKQPLIIILNREVNVGSIPPDLVSFLLLFFFFTK